ADEADADRAARRGGALAGDGLGRRRRRAVGVAERDREEALAGAAGQQVIRALGVVEREAMGQQLAEPDLLGGDRGEERLHVAVLGPPHVADRIVEALLLVLRVVAARPGRSREPVGELLLV